MSLECLICMEKCSFLKYLECRHSFCLDCLQQLKKSSDKNGEFIICPLDRTETILKDGVNRLQTNFVLICDNCSDETVVAKCWWCNSCDNSICSACAMEKHRNHNCNKWENYEIVNRCVNILQPYAKDKTNIDQQIHDFCIQLETMLKDSFAEIAECDTFLSNVNLIFGSVANSTQLSGAVTHFTRNLSTVVKLVQYSSSETNHFSPNIDLLKQLPGTPTKKLTLSTVNEIVAKCFEKTITQSENISVKDQEKTVKLQWPSAVKTKCINPSCLCPVDNGITIIDSEGIFYYSADLQKYNFKFFAELHLKSKATSAVYHQIRKSVFVMTELDKNSGEGFLLEYSIPSISYLNTFTLPEDGFIAPCFINVLCDGRIICCQGIKGCAYLWIKSYPLSPKGQWKAKWCNGSMKEFLAVHVVRKSCGEDLLYILSKKLVYEFRITSTKTAWLRSIELKDDQCDLFVLFNELYYFTKTADKFIPVLKDVHYTTQLLRSQGEKKNFVSFDNLVYYLDCNNTLKVGLIR